MKDLIQEYNEYLRQHKAVIRRANLDEMTDEFIKIQFDKLYALPDILSVVSYKTGISVDQMKQRTRRGEIVEARKIAMTIMWRESKKNRENGNTGMSLNEIALYFSLPNQKPFDHGTVIHSNKSIDNLCFSDKYFRARFREIEDAVRENLEHRRKCA